MKPQLLDTPSPSASVGELADHAELVCWQRGTMSITELANCLGRLEENDYSEDGVPEEDDVEEIVEDVLSEMLRRSNACRDGYPFEITNNGYTLVATPSEESHKFLLYRYFLLATRLNMLHDRQHAGMDGTLLFEKVAAEIARNYFGCRAKAFVFGTASDIAKFEDRINYLCRQMGLPYKFETKDNTLPTAQDGKLDIVVWKAFADQRDGMLIGFGQCKTGTHYLGHVTELQPSGFCQSWFDTIPAVLPVRLFLITDTIRDSWYYTVTQAGLLFDRCRLIDYANEVPYNVLRNVKAWTKEAAIAAALIE